ncbi:MAG TPA: tetratricopeptide repeat protein [Terracidiphilus sp.]|nr:tetratricopeptide repeat protein [Terracidiphilus sp.]
MRRFDRYRIYSASALISVLGPLTAAAGTTPQVPGQQSAPAQTQAASPSAQATSQTPAQPATAPASVAATPQRVPTPEELGDSLMSHQRYQAAIEAYKKAPKDSAGVWNKMGIAYQMMFNQVDALRCYQESIKLDPKNPNVWNNMGTVYDSQHEYRQAVKMYHKALKLDPQLPLVLKNLGTDLLAQHKYEKGWEAYQAAIAINPTIFGTETGPRVENPSSIQQRGAMNYYMAKSCVRAGLNDRAIEYLRMALNEGFTSPKRIEADREFAGLRTLPAFQQLLTEQRTP